MSRKIIVAVIMGLTFGTISGFAGVGIVNSGAFTSSNFGSPTNVYTLSNFNASGADKLVVTAVSEGAEAGDTNSPPIAISSVTFNGVSLTPAFFENDTGSGTAQSRVRLQNAGGFYLDNPFQGTGDIVVTYNVKTGGIGLGAFAFSGTLPGIGAANTDASTSLDLTTTANNSAVVAAFVDNGNGSGGPEISSYVNVFSSKNTGSSAGASGYVVDAGAAGLHTITATGTSARPLFGAVELKADPSVRDTILWSDNFDNTTAEQQINSRPGWTAMGLNGGWRGTNTTSGIMLQRPMLSGGYTGNGWRGATYTGTAFEPDSGDTMIVEFDWTVYTAGRENKNMLDLCMLTYMPTSSPTAYVDFDNADSAMSFRLRQSAYQGGSNQNPNGLISIDFCETTNPVSVASFDPAVLGLAPQDGDNAGDPVRVSYELEKTTNTDVWAVSLLISNINDPAKTASVTVNVTNAAFYALSDFYFSSVAADPLTNPALPAEGNEFDNFTGIMRGPALPTGFDFFVMQYDLSGVKTADYDGDGLNDWGEYVFDGNPTNSNSLGTQPTFDAASGNYLFSLLGDDSITAYVVTKDDLTLDPVWVHAATVSVTSTDGMLGSYTNFVGTSEGTKFIRLEIE